MTFLGRGLSWPIARERDQEKAFSLVLKRQEPLCKQRSRCNFVKWRCLAQEQGAIQFGAARLVWGLWSDRKGSLSSDSWGPPSERSVGQGGASHRASLSCTWVRAVVGSHWLDPYAFQSLPVACTRNKCTRVWARMCRLQCGVCLGASLCTHIGGCLQGNEAYLTFTVGQIREN